MTRSDPLEDFIGKTLAFGVVGDVMLVLHTNDKPDPAEWTAHAEAIGALNRRAGKAMRNLVVTDGGAPDRSQSAQLNAVIAERDFPTAVVIDKPAIRMVISVLAIWNWRIKSFAPSELQAVKAYLDLDDAQARAVLKGLRRLGGSLSNLRVLKSLLGAGEPVPAAV